MKINAVFGIALVIPLCAFVFDYVASSFSIQVDLGFMSLEAGEAGWLELVGVLAMTVLCGVYWVACPLAMGQLEDRRKGRDHDDR